MYGGGRGVRIGSGSAEEKEECRFGSIGGSKSSREGKSSWMEGRERRACDVG